jgi:hypothetical protein
MRLFLFQYPVASMRTIKFVFPFIICTTMLLSGCGRHNRKIVNANSFKRDFKYIYSNQLLDTRIAFFGDYKFSVPIHGEIKYKQSSLWRQRVTKLFTARTTISPFINCVGYVLKKNDPEFYARNGFKDTTDSILVKRTGKENSHIIQETILIRPAYDIWIISWSDLTTNKTDFVNLDQLEEVFVDEMNQIMASVSATNRQAVPNPFEIAEVAFNNAKAGNYLLPLDTLAKMKDSYQQNPDYKDLYLQTLASYASFVGDEASVRKHLAARLGNDTPIRNLKSGEFETLTGLDNLIKLISGTQVVMFNESHFFPQHRDLVWKLLPYLRKQGFKYLALEGLEENSNKLHKRGFPTLSSGFYVREYRMASLIRSAISLGYKVVSYDQIKNRADREIIQASNLYKNTIRKDSKSKVIVLAGHSHINEKSVNEKKWMAEYFNEISGINPLTINQERYADRKGNDSLDTSALIILKPKNGSAHRNDLYIINNLSGNKGILSKEKTGTVAVNINFLKPSPAKRTLVRLYRSEEYNLVGNPSPCLTALTNECVIQVEVPDGNYIMIGESENRKYLKKVNVLNGKSSISDI